MTATTRCNDVQPNTTDGEPRTEMVCDCCARLTTAVAAAGCWHTHTHTRTTNTDDVVWDARRITTRRCGRVSVSSSPCCCRYCAGGGVPTRRPIPTNVICRCASDGWSVSRPPSVVSPSVATTPRINTWCYCRPSATARS